MCLGIPGQVIRVWDAETGARMARVRFPDTEQDLCLAYVPDLQVGEYTIAHAGFALSHVDEAAAMATLRTMVEYGVLEDRGVSS
ncbi:HypC/HybG/HupF family hydrogenase formation chaperone [Pseudonocardia sp. NPDC049635]|uniref:HypC/HybG/HupF family hydrogenase formation chaperone n=1 Tax=Pseudonocardia sp. NPDC049635 TaxID=3155506 RepID=UPI0033DF808B